VVAQSAIEGLLGLGTILPLDKSSQVKSGEKHRINYVVVVRPFACLKLKLPFLLSALVNTDFEVRFPRIR